MPVQMELNKIIIREIDDQQIIVLKEVDGEREFSIVIGVPEAYAIDRRLKGIATQRPLTHDLLANIIEEMGGTIEFIERYRDVTGGREIPIVVVSAAGAVTKSMEALGVKRFIPKPFDLQDLARTVDAIIDG